MNSIQSCADTSGLRDILQRCYPVKIDQIALHRDMIGCVYMASGQGKKYALKLYRPFESENALCTIGILQYLKSQGYPVVSMISTTDGSAHVTIHTPQGASVAILYDFVEGVEPDVKTEMEHLGRQVGQMHRLMHDYHGPIICRGRDFYIDRYIAILRQLNYAPERIASMEAYGHELWARMQRLPGGFCHGDLHTGNMVQNAARQYVLFDFDAAARSHSVIDAATLCDGSNFNHFHEAAYDETLRKFERFYRGYSLESSLCPAEIAAIFDFIPIRHYDIIATITHCKGLEELSPEFLDEQYDWMLRWQKLCDR